MFHPGYSCRWTHWSHTLSVHEYQLLLPFSTPQGGKIINTEEMQGEFLDMWNQLNMCGKLLGYKWIFLLCSYPSQVQPVHSQGLLVMCSHRGPLTPPAEGTLDSQHDNTCRHFNILRTVKSRTFVNSCLGDRGEWRPLPFLMSILQLLAGLCSQLTKQQRKTKKERKPVFASARDWESRDYSLQLHASSWATSAGRVFLLAKKITSKCLVVASCAEQSRNVIISLTNSSKWDLKCWGCLQTHFQLNLKKVKDRDCSELIVTMSWFALPTRFQTEKWGFSLKPGKSQISWVKWETCYLHKPFSKSLYERRVFFWSEYIQIRAWNCSKESLKLLWPPQRQSWWSERS